MAETTIFEANRKGQGFVMKPSQLRFAPDVELRIPPLKTSIHDLATAGWSMTFQQDTAYSTKCRARLYPEQRAKNYGISFCWNHREKYHFPHEVFLDLAITSLKVNFFEDSRPNLSLDAIVEKIGETGVVKHINDARYKALGDFRPEEPAKLPLIVGEPIREVAKAVQTAPMIFPFDYFDSRRPKNRRIPIRELSDVG